MALFGNLFRDKSRDEEFCVLCGKGSYDEISKALESWGFAQAKDNSGKTALMYAAESSKDPKVIELLREKGADIVAKFNGRSALMYAVDAGNIEAVKVLARNNEGLNAQDSDGRTALSHAVFDEFKQEIFDVLVKSGANLEVSDNQNNTILMHAVSERNNNSDLIKTLVNAGAKLNASGSTAKLLIMAIDSGVPQKLLTLIDLGADVNDELSDGTTALFHASGLKTPDAVFIVNTLLNSGAKVNPFTNKEGFALDHALNAGNTEIANILRAAGGMRDFYTLCMKGTFDEVLTELKTGRVNVNFVFNNGMTPLMLALDNDDIEVFKLLIQAGANINACGKMAFKGTCTVLDMAKIRQVSPFGKMKQRVNILRRLGAQSLHPELWR